MYDLTIIGGGSAGLVLAVAGAKLGKKTALVEKHRIGGDCLWTGCVPSKALAESGESRELHDGTRRNTGFLPQRGHLTGSG